jgi:hypothetical protein
MDITRYNGKRFITEEEIDREFIGHWVLVSTNRDIDREGYLIASAEGRDELRPILEEIGILEFNSDATIIYGCKERGGNLHVELLG